MQALVFYALYPLIWLLSRAPFRIIYLLSDFISFILFHVVRYRREVMMDNISVAFAAKENKWVKKTARESTLHLTDVFLEMIKSMGMTKAQMEKRFTVKNLSLLDTIKAENHGKQKPIMMMFAHYASYEWAMSFQSKTDQHNYGVYKPVKNKYVNRLIKKIRKKFNTTLIPMYDSGRIIAKSIVSGEAAMYGMIADQSPKRGRASHFTEFLGRPSAVFVGSEKLARRYDTAVIYMQINRISRGRYEAQLLPITLSAATTEEWEITDSFFQNLQKQIRHDPTQYLWSHKRWKISIDKVKKPVKRSPRLR